MILLWDIHTSLTVCTGLAVHTERRCWLRIFQRGVLSPPWAWPSTAASPHTHPHAHAATHQHLQDCSQTQAKKVVERASGSDKCDANGG